MTSTSMPWVKLYTEFLDDPKIGRLPDSAKLRFIQLILIAGECDCEGCFMSGDQPMTTAEMAWRLRVDAAQLEKDILSLEDSGVMTNLPDGTWQVKNFTKRQGRPQGERQQRWRENQKAKRTKDKEAASDDETDGHPAPSGDTKPADKTPDKVSSDDKKSVIDDTTMTRRPRVEKSRYREEESREEERLGADAPLPKQNPPENVWAKGIKKPKTAKPADPRSSHPAILLVRELTKQYPSETVYDKLITALGDSPDKAKALSCYSLWVEKGFNPRAMTAFTEWYVNGCPEPYKAPVIHAAGNPAPQKGYEKSRANLSEVVQRIRATRDANGQS
jgi:hypothetical protein